MIPFQTSFFPTKQSSKKWSQPNDLEILKLIIDKLSGANNFFNKEAELKQRKNETLYGNRKKERKSRIENRDIVKKYQIRVKICSTSH